MGESTVYIRTGLGETYISSKMPFCLPVFQSIQIFERDALLNVKGSLELGFISKDNFFLDVNIQAATITKMENEIILKAFAQGKERNEILTGSLCEILRENFKAFNFSEIETHKDDIHSAITKELVDHGIESCTFEKFEVQRTALDDYDLENIIHFEAAKDIVTRIARVQIKDHDFIDKCRKTIAHFDIVDE